HDGLFAAAFSPDGRTILTGCGDRTARLWTLAEQVPGSPLRPQGRVAAMAFSRDGTTVAAGCNNPPSVNANSVGVWEAATGKPVGSPPDYRLRIQSVTFSPDGKTILTGDGRDGTARLWDAATGKPVGVPLRHRYVWVNAVAFSPDAKTLITNGTLKQG